MDRLFVIAEIAQENSAENRFDLWFAIFCVIAFLFAILAIRSMVYAALLRIHLRKYHIEKWKYLTSFLVFGPGGQNSLRMISFVFGDEDLDDPEVVRLKTKIRKSVIYMAICVFVLFIVTIGGALLLAPK